LSIGEGPLTGTAQTSITIDRPPVVVGSYDLDTVADGYPTGGSGAALTGDSDPDGDALTIMSVSDFRGTMAAGTGIAGAYGELTLEGDGSYTYYAYNTMAIDAAPIGTPPVDQFTFTVSDGYGGIATEGFYVTINRAPLIASGGFTATVTESGQVTGGSGALLAGDSDPDGYALTIPGFIKVFSPPPSAACWTARTASSPSTRTAPTATARPTPR
jgi:VCBS repeat-containing protein